jgi:hypothetical protein
MFIGEAASNDVVVRPASRLTNRTSAEASPTTVKGRFRYGLSKPISDFSASTSSRVKLSQEIFKGVIFRWGI